jgi:glucose/arabinose dehydrogenase
MRAALSVLLLACLAHAAPPPQVQLREVASGIAQPTAIAFPPDGTRRMFVTEQTGRVRAVQDGIIEGRVYLDLRASVSTVGEQGLLGIAFHPRYATNRRAFLYYTRLDGSLRISEFTTSLLTGEAPRDSEREILTIPHPGHTNHNGGQLAFGPDGYLYIGVGDGGAAGDPPNNAQNLAVLLGKILRIDVDGAPPYAIPPENPFVGNGDARGEIWAYGLRNPWRFSFDRMTGDILIGDVGQNANEEVDFAAHGAKGLNFGWRVFEGLFCYSPPAGCTLADHTRPILQYRHDAAGGDSVTGGYVYRGMKSAALAGYYFYGDFVSNRLWAATREAGQWTSYPVASAPLAGISTFGEDEAGEIYVASYSTGRIYAIDGPGPGINPALRCDVAAGCLPRRVPR